MAVNRRHMSGLQPSDVWEVLADGETYAYWVVGTRDVREVKGDWPEPGSAIHYVVGHLPLRKDDHTVSVRADRNHHLELEAHAWPAGTLYIGITLDRSPTGVTVTIEEGPKKGLLKKVDNPLVDLGIKARNVETLRRLEKKTRERVGKPANEPASTTAATPTPTPAPTPAPTPTPTGDEQPQRSR